MPNDDYEYRLDSIAWEPLLDNKGNQKLDYRGRPLYQSVFVPVKDKNTIFCPYCNKYKEIDNFDLGYGAKEKGCKDCGVTLKDFHMKRVNDIK